VFDWPLFVLSLIFRFFDPFAVNVHTIVIWRQNGSDASHDADSEQRSSGIPSATERNGAFPLKKTSRTPIDSSFFF
jgi:hypothetical protein